MTQFGALQNQRPAHPKSQFSESQILLDGVNGMRVQAQTPITLMTRHMAEGFTVAVSQPADVADHGPHSGGACEGGAGGVPGRGLRPLVLEPAVQARRHHRKHTVYQLSPAGALRNQGFRLNDI